MNFSEVYNLILESCPFLSGNLYDGIIVKKLAATNTISDTGSSHQSHMAFTGKQKDFFPFLEADGYFNVGYDDKDDDLKKYFTLRIPLNIYADNVEVLSEMSSPIQFESKTKRVRASVLRSRRRGQEDQVELSIKSLDDADFIEFRKLLRVNDFFILLKKQNVLEYDLVGIKSGDENAAKLATCTDFYKNATQTPVDINCFNGTLIETKVSSSKSNITPIQIIYYGVPGCGKSHKITSLLKNEKVKDPTFSEENQVVRTTFHPEYTNADFIGQILPEVHENAQGTSVVEYKFKPGPFAKILKQALYNPGKPFYLVIEEINRGNAAAIFGDVFQLLDRLKVGDTSMESVGTDGFENHYGKGWSEYFEMNADVNAYIRDANSEDELDTKAIDVSGIHFSSSTGLRLPPNLSIYATMNTSDQNVFTLDNAFQRRWDMELIPNTCNWDDTDHKKQAQLPIGDTDICWETFRAAINSEISGGEFFNADDKQLGLFFI